MLVRAGTLRLQPDEDLLPHPRVSETLPGHWYVHSPQSLPTGGHTCVLCGPYWSVLSLSYFLHEGLKNLCGSDPVSEQLKTEGEGVGSEEDSEKLPLKVHLTPLELEGLWNLLGKLEALPSNKKCVPAGIHNAPALITHIKVSLVCMSSWSST